MKLMKMVILVLILATGMIFQPSSVLADWQKMDPPPDVDKESNSDLTCWLATAANMLAGAGYGYSSPDASTVQARADYIYEELKGHFNDYT